MSEVTNEAKAVARLDITAHGAGEWSAHEHEDGMFVLYGTHAAEVERLEAEVAENEAVINVWRRRCEAAERRVRELLAAIKEYRLFASCGNREAIARLDAITKESP